MTKLITVLLAAIGLLAGCGEPTTIVAASSSKSPGNVRGVYWVDSRTNLCFMESDGYGLEKSQTNVPCTSEVLAIAIKHAED